MARFADLPVPADGRLVANITHFARALRAAGLPVGPGRVIGAVRAVEAAGFSSREDFSLVLEACFVSRPEHRAVFAQVFRLYWRDPRFLEQMMSLMLPMVRGANAAPDPAAAERRAAEALLAGAEAPPPPPTTTTRAGPRQVTYSVTGTKAPGDIITVTYIDASGRSRTQRNVYIPWSLTVTPISQSEVGSVQASSLFLVSRLNCSITTSDGTVLSSNTGNAAQTSC
mgnify:CR=1 FL=1